MTTKESFARKGTGNGPRNNITRSAAERKRRRDRDAKTKEAASERIPKRAYSIVEAAVTLGVSVPTINRRIYNGSLPSMKLLGRRVITAETIDQLLAVSPPPGCAPAAGGGDR